MANNGRAGVMPNVNDPTWVNLIGKIIDNNNAQTRDDNAVAARAQDHMAQEEYRRADQSREPDRIRARGSAQIDVQQEADQRGIGGSPTNTRYRGRINPDLDAAIVRATASAGRPDLADTLRRVAMVESSGGYNNVNPRSSARGPWQFIQGTGEQYGLDTAGRMDINRSTDAVVRLTIDNERALKNAGIDPTPGALYMAHQQGAGGAVRILSNPNGNAAATVGRRAVLLNGGNANMSNAQFAQRWLGRFGTPETNRRNADRVGVQMRAPTDQVVGGEQPGQVAQPAAQPEQLTDERGRPYRRALLQARDGEAMSRAYPGRFQIDTEVAPNGRPYWRDYGTTTQPNAPASNSGAGTQAPNSPTQQPATRGVAAQPAQPPAGQPRQMNGPPLPEEEEEDE